MERSAKSSSSQDDAARAGHGDEVNDMIGRASRRMQGDDAVDEGALVEDRRDRRVFIAEGGDRQGALRGGGGERVAQGRIRVDEGAPRQMQAHHLHQHLV